MALSAVRSAPGIHLVAGLGAVAGIITAASRLTPAEAAALWSGVTLTTGVISGLLRRPPHVAVTATAVSAVVGDLAAFNVHVPPGVQGTVMAALALLTGSVVHLSAAQPVAAPRPPASPPEVTPQEPSFTIPPAS